MILCKWDAPEGDPGQSCVHQFACILWTSFSSVSIFSVCCYSIVSISMPKTHFSSENNTKHLLFRHCTLCTKNSKFHLRKMKICIAVFTYTYFENGSVWIFYLSPHYVNYPHYSLNQDLYKDSQMLLL